MPNPVVKPLHGPLSRSSEWLSHAEALDLARETILSKNVAGQGHDSSTAISLLNANSRSISVSTHQKLPCFSITNPLNPAELSVSDQ